MEVSISQMIEMIEDHFDGGWYSPKALTVGGVAGTSLFKHAINACLKTIPLEQILVVDGCQDYIGLLRKPISNYVYYMELFRAIEIPNILRMVEPGTKHLVEPLPGYQIQIADYMIMNFKALIIQNAQLLPMHYLSSLIDCFCGKVLCLVDPLDINGERFSTVPTLYDSLTKQTKTISLARSMYGIETRSIDRRVRCDFKKVKMNRRGIGKIDDKQYVTNSAHVLKTVREKQLQAQFRRNQKFLVAQKHIGFLKDQNDMAKVIGPDTMLSIMTASKPLMKLRIHSSTSQVYSTLSYMENTVGLYVKPANIVSIEEAVKHRFNNIVVVLGDEPMTTRQWYSLLKIGNNISITDF